MLDSWRKALVCSALSLVGLAAPAAADSVRLVSRVDPGSASATASGGPSLTYEFDAGPGHGRAVSADGRYVAFTSSALNLAPGQRDTNQAPDVFLHDRTAGTVVLVSRAAGTTGQTGNQGSSRPVISSDGRFVAFVSEAADLVPGQNDLNNVQDIFLYDRVTETTLLVSRAAGSAATTADAASWAPVISADGNWVAFSGDAGNLVAGVGYGHDQVYLFSRTAGTNVLVSHASGVAGTGGNGTSFSPTLSADGSYLAYVSNATNLVAGQTDSNGEVDVFLYDRAANHTALVSRSATSLVTAGNSGADWGAISADGATVAFSSTSSNLVAGQSGPSTQNVFLYQRSNGVVSLVSRSASGASRGGNAWSGEPAVSGDGQWVAFSSFAGDLLQTSGSQYFARQVCLFQRSTGAITLLSRAHGTTTQPASHDSRSPWISSDGGQVAFVSYAQNLLPNTQLVLNVYLYTRASGSLAMLGRSPNTASLETEAYSPVLSANGQVVAFTSGSELVAGDGNLQTDVFLYNRATGAVTVASRPDPASPALTPPLASSTPSISDDGNYVVFESLGSTLVPGQVDPELDSDVFLWSRRTGATALLSRSAASPVTGANSGSWDPTISADGEWILFRSGATDVVPGQGPGIAGLVLYERAIGARRLVTHAAGSPTTPGDGYPDSSEAPALSMDGRFVAYLGYYSNVVQGQSQGFRFNAFLYDRVTAGTTLVSHAASSPLTSGNGDAYEVAMSADGRFVVFASEATNLVTGQTDANEAGDIFLFDRDTGAVSLVSRQAGSSAVADRGSWQPEISADGRWIAFLSAATNLVPGQADTDFTNDLFLFDRVTGEMRLVSHALGAPAAASNGSTEEAFALSADGRFLAFTSYGQNLTPGPISGSSYQNVFLYDRTTGQNVLVSHAAGSANASGSGIAGGADMSADGRYVTFWSTSHDQVPGVTDGNGVRDAYLYDRITGEIELLSRTDGAPAEAAGGEVATISADGGQVVLLSEYSLVFGDYNVYTDVYLYENLLPAADFHTLATPCRLLDTRTPQHGPALASGVRGVLPTHGGCGIPATAKALALNVTVTQAAGSGYLKIHPANTATPASTVNFLAGQTRSNNAIVRLSTRGDGTLALTPQVNGNGTVHVILDVVGWFE